MTLKKMGSETSEHKEFWDRLNSPESQKRFAEWQARQELERQRLVALYSQNPSWIAKAEASGNPTEFWKHFYIGRVV